MDLSHVLVEPLGRHHGRAAFHCGEEALDLYLKQQAKQDADKCVAASFVAVNVSNANVLGYYTLSAMMLSLLDLPDGLARKLPRYPWLPVTLLGRLAVDQATTGKGLGEHLLLDSLRRSWTHAHQVAAMAVVVNAKSEAAARFYCYHGFKPLQAHPRRLFVPMTTVAKLLGE